MKRRVWVISLEQCGMSQDGVKHSLMVIWPCLFHVYKPPTNNVIDWEAMLLLPKGVNVYPYDWVPLSDVNGCMHLITCTERTCKAGSGFGSSSSDQTTLHA
jgi:hypothetical protein